MLHVHNLVLCRSKQGWGTNPLVAVISTSADGVSDLNGCSFKLNNGAGWTLTIRRSSDNRGQGGGHEYLTGDLQLITPLYSGTLHVNMSLKNGTKWANLGAGTVKVTHANYTNKGVVDQMRVLIGMLVLLI